MKKDIPGDVGWVLIFFPKHEPGKCALVSNINEREMRDQIAALQKRWSDHPRIIIPGGD